jgi:hypothetical protein
MKFSHAGTDKIKVDLTGIASSSSDALSRQIENVFGGGIYETLSLHRWFLISIQTPDGSIAFTFTAAVGDFLKLISYADTTFSS